MTIKRDETSSTDKNRSTWRVWMGYKVNNLKIYGGTLAILMSVIVAWNTLDWPTPAWSTDIKATYVKIEATYTKIAEVKQFAVGTRALVLDQAWYRIRYQLDDVDSRLKRDSNNVDLRALHRNLTRQLVEMDRQLKEFRK